MRNLLKLNKRRKKAQFYVLSAFAIVTIIYFVSKWMEPLTIIDTSQTVLMDEIFIFNNIKEKAIETAKVSKNCEDLKYNLQEYSEFIKSYMREKGKLLLLQYQFISPCFDNPPTPAVIEFNLTLISPNIRIESVFPVYFIP